MTKWRWMPGMRTKNNVRVIEVEEPDWEDPATRGCLLEQVRWRHGAECWAEYRTGKGWRVVYPVGGEETVVVTEWHGTEPEALLAALEEAE